MQQYRGTTIVSVRRNGVAAFFGARNSLGGQWWGRNGWHDVSFDVTNHAPIRSSSRQG